MSGQASSSGGGYAGGASTGGDGSDRGYNANRNPRSTSYPENPAHLVGEPRQERIPNPNNDNSVEAQRREAERTQKNLPPPPQGVRSPLP